jgi:hypothetical protein
VSSRLGRRYITSDLNFRAVHTSRCRLIQVNSPVFSLQHVKGVDKKISDGEHSNIFSLDVDGQLVKLIIEHAENIDYWEIDPAWDGYVFHSATQAIRSRIKKVIDDRLVLPFDKSNLSICARIVDIHGKTYWIKK